MASPLDDAMGGMRTHLMNCSAYLTFCGDKLQWAGIYLKIGDTDTAGDYMLLAASRIKSASNYLYGGITDYWDYEKEALEWIDENIGGEITWKDICEAWAKDDFEGKEWTIAIIDHMRKLMWDEPFKIVWASKPSAESG